MGIDYGSKRVGISTSDEGGEMAFPKEVLQNDRFLIENIKKIYDKEGIQNIVMGESKDYKGKPNPIMADILKFKKDLEKKINTTIHLEPEYMTSAQAVRLPQRIRRGQEHIRNKSDKLDASAATIILQSFLDKQKNGKR